MEMEHRKNILQKERKCSRRSRKNISKNTTKLTSTEEKVFDEVYRESQQRSIAREKIENLKQKNGKDEKQLEKSNLTLNPHSLEVSSSFKEILTGCKFNDQPIIGASSLGYLSEFPALNEKYLKTGVDNPDDSRSSINNLEQIVSHDEGSVNCSTLNRNTGSDISNTERKAPKRVPRTERPITFDLVEANELCKMKKLQSKKCKRLVKRRDQPTPYVGNILDSDKPLKHKGKIRLNRKKRVTKIKSVILERRRAWKAKKSEWKSSFDNSQKIKLTTDMIKDALVLKSCNFQLHEKGENSNLQIICGHPDKDDGFLSKEVDSELHDDLVTKNDSTNKSEQNFEFNENSNSYLDDNLNVIDSQTLTPKRIIHSKRFAIYCDQWPIKELTDAVNELLRKLDCFQQKTQACDPLKLYSKRRFNLGLTEVTKYLRLGKILMVIFATDIEEIDGEGGLLDTINNIRKIASLQRVPFVFANTQKKLKAILKKNARISCIGIRNYEGADKHFKTILELLPEAKRKYIEKLDNAEIMCGVKNEELEVDPNVAVVQSLLSKLTSPSTEKDKTNNLEKGTGDACPLLSAIMKHTNNTKSNM